MKVKAVDSQLLSKDQVLRYPCYMDGDSGMTHHSLSLTSPQTAEQCGDPSRTTDYLIQQKLQF